MPPRFSVSPHASLADAAACRLSLRGGSRTFHAASLVLPKSVRKPATALYAFCRMADDAIDQGADRAAALEDLHERLHLIYAGAPRNVAADRAFADTVHRHRIPQRFPRALLEGFGWDADNRRYADLSQLRAYGVRVAGTVGVMLALVMDVSDAASLARACDLGVAMQLTNIARDVGEDARNGRLYLPLAWLRDAGIDHEQWLAQPRFSPALSSVIERLLGEAEILYARSEAGLDELPAACRPGMYAARLLYAEIGRELARQRFDSVTRRAVVPWQRKARILADAAQAATRRERRLPQPGLMEEADFLLSVPPQAVANAASVPVPVESARERARWPRLEDRVAWLVDLFERLEKRDQKMRRGIRNGSIA